MTKTLVITDDQLHTIIAAMYDKLVESKRYCANSKVSETPRESDLCCREHLLRYNRNLALYESMVRRVREDEDLIQYLELMEK